MYSRAVGRILAGLAVALVGLIALCWHRRGGTGVDHWVAARLTGAAGWSLTDWLGHATDPWYVLIGAGALAIRHEQDGRRRRALALVVPVVAALAVTELVLKPGVDARAATGPWTFPSGNVTGGVALATAVYWVEVRRRASRWRVAAWAGLILVVALSSFGLVAYRTHFFTDAVGGICVGVGVPLALLGHRRTSSRREPDTESYAAARTGSSLRRVDG